MYKNMRQLVSIVQSQTQPGGMMLYCMIGSRWSVCMGLTRMRDEVSYDGCEM
jgi:hypothetical protein